MQGLKIEQSRTNGSTTSTLTWIPTIDDHQATFKCAVWNKAMQSMAPYEKDFQLQVECKYLIVGATSAKATVVC